MKSFDTPRDSTPLGRTVFFLSLAGVFIGIGILGMIYSSQGAEIPEVAEEAAALRKGSWFALFFGGVILAVTLIFKPWRMRK